MDDPSRRLRVVLVLPAVFVVVPVVLVGPVFLALFVIHIGSSFLCKLLLRWEICLLKALGGCENLATASSV